MRKVSSVVRKGARRSWHISSLPGHFPDQHQQLGLGGRFGYYFHRKVMMEKELAYDCGINFRKAYRYITNGDITAAPCKSENLGVVSRPPLRFHFRSAQ